MALRLAMLATAAALAACGCAMAATSPASSAPSTRLTVFAAASLTATMAKVKGVYEAANPGTTLAVSTDSSAALETAIEQGAPADVLLSADLTNPQKLVDAGLADGGVVPFAGNYLAVIVPSTNPAGISSPLDLAKVGVKIITCAESVPIARYAAQLIDNLGSQAGYPTDFATRYAANVVSREANVSAVVSKIELGEGDAGIVYATDAKASTRVSTIAVPDAANVPAAYGGAVVKASKSRTAAHALMAWLTGTGGQAVLASFGFVAPPAG